MTQLIEKLESKTRLTYEDGVKLWELDLFTLGKFADRIRREKMAIMSFSTTIATSTRPTFALTRASFALLVPTAKTQMRMR